MAGVHRRCGQLLREIFSVGWHHPADRDVGRVPDAIRSEPGAARPAHCVHVGEAALRVHGDPNNWDRLKDDHGRAMLGLWQKHAPNLADAVIDSFTRSALDTERTLPNMREGDLLVGAFANGQVGADRPFPGAGHYRAHIPGLYLCGSSSHPGGNITGLPAYNAAQVILADLGIKADWVPPPFAGRLAAV